MNAPLPMSPLADLPAEVLHGAGPEAAAMLGLADLSLVARYGVKGPGAAAWLGRAGLPVPAAPNRWLAIPGGLVARLGMTEYLVEADADTIARLQATPRTEGVYPVLRQDGAFVLGGAQLQPLLRQVCNVNLARLGPDEVVLTSMAGVGVTVLAEGRRFRLWCDGTYAAYLWETLTGIARELGGGPVSAHLL